MKASNLKSQLVIIAIILAILSGFAGCTGKSPKDVQTQDEGITLDEPEDEKDELVREVLEYPLPTSFEVTKLLIEAGAGYILDICNRTENAGKYISLKSKALNLGIYGADLSYAATYNQTQETMQYLEASAKLIDELQISTAFNQILVDRVERNLDNVDSLIIIISDSFYETYEYLQANEQDNLSLLVMTGSWIEALFISTQISIISTDNQKIVEIISDQSSSLSELLNLLEEVKDDPMITDIYSGLLDIKALYDASASPMNPEELDRLITATENIRKSIV
ncbi:MAG: hypothetical protein AMS27_03395 [Bacteroides sp. SM23_62_1]|nr:MAG: hypothetical protein AMS27_03395 [Bacteroides sp. SM23_62_1]